VLDGNGVDDHSGILKFVEKFLGNDLTIFGGSTSISPPLGFPRFAHEKINKIEIDIFIRFLIIF